MAYSTWKGESSIYFLASDQISSDPSTKSYPPKVTVDRTTQWSFFFFSWQIQSLSPSKNKSLFLAVPCPSQKDNSLLLAASLSLVNYPVVSPALCISPITRNSTGNTLHQSGLTFFSKLTCTRVPVCVSTHACVHVILEHLRQES